MRRFNEKEIPVISWMPIVSLSGSSFLLGEQLSNCTSPQQARDILVSAGADPADLSTDGSTLLSERHGKLLNALTLCGQPSVVVTAACETLLRGLTSGLDGESHADDGKIQG